jgi:photosynthetic reaction center cytochrome c subunit
MVGSGGRLIGLLSVWVLSGSVIASDTEVPRSKPVNLKVLPQDISPAKLGKLMKRFEQELGVSCRHCHVENAETQKLDYASDDNAAKQTARIMIAMLNDINDKYLSQLGGDRRYATPVTCGSCHQGQSNPPAFEGKWR